jgi:hypothetical protein
VYVCPCVAPSTLFRAPTNSPHCLPGDYWVVNQILAKQLHNADEECLQFTTTMMDQLEQMKSEHAGNEAILNDAKGEAAVEQFAHETFERALRPLKANKVTQYVSTPSPNHHLHPYIFRGRRITKSNPLRSEPC